MTSANPPKDALAGQSVVARADALMQRRKAQLTTESDDLPVLTEAVSVPEDEDFPLLTAIAETAPPSVAPSAPPRAQETDANAFNKLAADLTKTITARLNAELPHLVHIALQETLAHVEQELKNGIDEATQAALRDFLKEQGKHQK